LVKTTNSSMSRVLVPTVDGIQIINVHEILYLKSSDIYSYIHTSKGEIFTMTSLGTLEKGLKEYSFFRCHKSYLVNLDHLSKVIKGTNYKLMISTDLKIPLSRTKKKLLMEHLNSLKHYTPLPFTPKNKPFTSD